MFEILGLYRIPKEIIEAIKVLYTDTTATILTPDGESSPFFILAGILQGDPCTITLHYCRGLCPEELSRQYS